MKKDLDYWLDFILVHPPGMWENDDITLINRKWWAISTAEEGIIAYFNYEVDAFNFRLNYINRKMNP